MTDIVIQDANLTKVYRLYTKPRYRFLDVLGLLGSRPNAFTEHLALAGIDLTIARGEKVAIIGRNGAGKSTLLKLVSNVIQPTAGSIRVEGQARALLQIGTGFHPDFTGRENVYAYLAHLGIVGKKATEKFVDVVDFAELDEYIDQPLKVYSTGMAMRLMFATSIAVTPNILVLDEVLSVGDAYFSQKSFERIGELCEREGTTLLLVSHDIYSAAKICPRMIWLDSGRVVMDGSSPNVIKAYEDSVRDQEERRLRKRNQSRLEELSRATADNVSHIWLELRSRNNLPPAGPIYFSRIELRAGGSLVAELPLGAAGTADASASHLQMQGTNWGEATNWNGRAARPMLNFGTPFYK